MAGNYGEKPVAVCECGNVKMEGGEFSYWSKNPGHVTAGKRLKLQRNVEVCCCCLGHPEQLGGFSGHHFELAA